MPNCIQMQLIIINCNPCNPTILAVYCRSTASQNHLRTIRSHTGLYVANLQHAKPTEAMPAMPNCFQMRLIATHVFRPFWLYIADLQRPKTTSERSVPTLDCMLPTYSMPNQLKPCRPCPTASKCNYLQPVCSILTVYYIMHVADLQRPKTTSEQSVPSALACMLPTTACQTNESHAGHIRPCPTASKCN